VNESGTLGSAGAVRGAAAAEAANAATAANAANAAKGGMMPMMPPPMMGGAQGAGSQDRERSTWLTESEDIWGSDDGDVAPPLIG
jgi:hypothetical protein